ncbi:hypothetical protein ACOSQ2_017650 [Xanthoceras sorbifolium]
MQLCLMNKLETFSLVYLNGTSKEIRSFLWDISPLSKICILNKLTARYSDKSYTSGRFELTLQSNGNLGLYIAALPLESTNSDYWSTKIAGSDFQLIFNQSGNIYLTARNGSMIYMLSTDAASEQDFYQRAILEHDGVFRHYVYPKNTSSSIERWGMHWSAQSFTPPNICMITGATGSGACGFNSYCRLGDLTNMPVPTRLYLLGSK